MVLIENPDEFKEWLRSVLHSESVADVVSNMIQRSRQKVSS